MEPEKQERQPIWTLVATGLFAFAWMAVAPRLFPDFFRPLKKAIEVAQKVADANEEAESGDPNLPPPLATAIDLDQADKQADKAELAPPKKQAKLFPHQAHTLGSLDPKSGYFLEVKLTSLGASLEEASLSDPRYKALDKPKEQLKVVGAKSYPERQTWQTSVKAIDVQLKKGSLNSVDWELLPGASPETVTFRFQAPDGSLEVRKKYSLQKGNLTNKDHDPTGYLLKTELTFENLGTQEVVKTTYLLQGPTGIPLEDVDNARSFIDLRVGVLSDHKSPDKVTLITTHSQGAVELLKKAEETQTPSPLVWRDPLRFAGVDVQFFAALIAPETQLKDLDGDLQADPYFAEIRPIILAKNEKKPQLAEVTLEMESKEFSILKGKPVVHQFETFLGPKRSELLAPLMAEPITELGWFSWICIGMLKLLNFFHYTLHIPYFFAIIMLTVIVRGFMFPLSIKQTLSSVKMQAIQPQIAEIKKKYETEPEKFLRAQQDLYRKNGVNPLAGCLPVFLQLPIFVALYNTINHAVDLRLAKFLWISNLAAPDAIYRFGRDLPLLGWNELNILPLITTTLYLVQNKMFMPPPTNEQEQMQQSMMKYMMIFMGYMFYKVPSGLCIYFIASSLWGMGERVFLKRFKPSAGTAAPGGESPGSGSEGLNLTSPVGPKPVLETTAKQKTWLDRLIAAADEARSQTNGQMTKSESKTEKKRRR